MILNHEIIQRSNWIIKGSWEAIFRVTDEFFDNNNNNNILYYILFYYIICDYMIILYYIMFLKYM